MSCCALWRGRRWTSRWRTLWHLLRRWRGHGKFLSDSYVRALPLHNFVDEILFFLLLNCFPRLVPRRLWRAEWVRRARSYQDMPCMHFLLGFPVLRFRAALFDFNYMKAKLALDDVANLSRL